MQRLERIGAGSRIGRVGIAGQYPCAAGHPPQCQRVPVLSAPPGAGFEQQLAPSGWKAWIDTAFTLAGVVYLLANRDVLAGASPPQTWPLAGQPVARHLLLLGVGWTILPQVMASRWRGPVQAGGRDRAIATRAAAAGRATLIVTVIALALLPGLSPVDRLQWALLSLLALQLLVAWLVEYLMAALMYWRDRR